MLVLFSACGLLCQTDRLKCCVVYGFKELLTCNVVTAAKCPSADAPKINILSVPNTFVPLFNTHLTAALQSSKQREKDTPVQVGNQHLQQTPCRLLPFHHSAHHLMLQCHAQCAAMCTQYYSTDSIGFKNPEANITAGPFNIFLIPAEE